MCAHSVAQNQMNRGHGMSHDWIEREILIEASLERVWAVLTEAQHVAGWFGDSAEIDLRPGGKAAFGWKEHGRPLAVVERVDDPNFLSSPWPRRPHTHPPHAPSPP